MPLTMSRSDIDPQFQAVTVREIDIRVIVRRQRVDLYRVPADIDLVQLERAPVEIRDQVIGDRDLLSRRGRRFDVLEIDPVLEREFARCVVLGARTGPGRPCRSDLRGRRIREIARRDELRITGRQISIDGVHDGARYGAADLVTGGVRADPREQRQGPAEVPRHDRLRNRQVRARRIAGQAADAIDVSCGGIETREIPALRPRQRRAAVTDRRLVVGRETARRVERAVDRHGIETERIGIRQRIIQCEGIGKSSGRDRRSAGPATGSVRAPDRRTAGPARSRPLLSSIPP